MIQMIPFPQLFKATSFQDTGEDCFLFIDVVFDVLLHILFRLRYYGVFHIKFPKYVEIHGFYSMTVDPDVCSAV